MSTIAAGTTSGTALVSTGDTTGALVLQTNGTTTAVTIATNQVVTLAQPLPVGSGGTGATSLSGITTGTATNLAGGSNGTIPYQSASGTTQMLAVGTAGQVLQTNGAGAPTWVTASAGALTLISTTTASGSANTLDITTGFSSTYDDYLVIGENIKLGVNSSESMDFRIYTGGSLRTSSYQYHAFGALGAASVSRATTSSVVSTSIQVYTATTISLNLFLRNANSASSRIQGQMHIMCSDDTNTDGNNQFSVSFGNTATTSALTGIRFLWQTGSSTFASGTFRLYGIAKS